jgi:hypothetical protein
MTTHRSRLLTILAAAALVAGMPARASASAALVTNLTGTLRIQQAIPCDGHIDTSTPVNGGQMQLAPPQGSDVSGGKTFDLTATTITFTPFSVGGSCAGFGETRHYEELGVQLAKAVTFTAVAGGGVYVVTIPKEDVLISEAAIVDGHHETALDQPSEDVTGTIDLTARTVTMHVVLTQSIHFQAGCAPLVGCAIDETDGGTLTADISGTLALPDVDRDGVADVDDNCKFTPNPDQTPVPTPVVTPPGPVTLTSCIDHNIGSARAVDVCDRTAVTITNDAPAAFHAGVNVVTWTGVDGKGRVGTATQDVTVIDTTPPTVSCTVTSPQGNSFIVAGDDLCGEPVLRLGSYVLEDGEQIKIEETGQGGVQFVDVVSGVRHFHVGKGQAIVTATDSSGNTASAVCR